jgi:hypothetical protein
LNLDKRIRVAISIGNLENENIRRGVGKRKCPRKNKEKNDIQISSKILRRQRGGENIF